MMIQIPVARDFDFAKILRFQPFFFFFSDKPVRTFFHDGKEFKAEFFQKSGFLCVKFDEKLEESEIDFFRGKISYCLGLDEDFSEFYRIVEKDDVLSSHMAGIRGNRLLSAFTDFEAAVCVICSQNVTFRLYKQMVKKIVDIYGSGRFFPTPQMILDAPEKLALCGVGYRDKFILDAAKMYLLRKNIDDSELMKIKGFGQYSYDIFRLFQERDYSYFYVDRLIKKIFESYYHAGLLNDHEVRDFAVKKFGKWAGLAEVYLQKFLCDNR